MNNETLVRHWFEHWEEGNFMDLPLTNEFTHTSPFGVIQGKDSYLNIVESNREKFLGYQFDIKDELHGESSSCVRYIGK